MSVRDCLDRLVTTGKITRAAATNADALWRRYQNKFSLDMPPAQADAAAALQAAREMMAASREKKNSVAKQVQRQTTAEREQMQHPWGPAAGGMAVLTRDIYRTGAQNVETRMQFYREVAMSKFNTGMEALKSTYAGLKQNTAGARELISELFDVDTGSPLAKAMAAGWKESTDYLVDAAKRAGKIFEPNEDWRLMQPWNGRRVQQIGAPEFINDVRNAVQSGGLKVFDKERLEFVTDPARLEVLLKKAADDIITEAGAAPVFSSEGRTFRFQQGKAGFDAFSALQDKYGMGNDILSTMTGHIGSMAREAALVDMLGPQHASTVATLVKNANAYQKRGKPGEGIRAARIMGMESAAAIDRTYSVLNGRANGVENYFWGSMLGSVRSLLSSSMLGSATVAAVPGDTVTMAWAAHYNGMDAGRVMARTVEVLAGEKPAAQETMARRLLVTGHALMDHAVSTTRYDQIAAPELLRKTSDFVVRATGLSHWTEGAKKAFSVEMLGYIADNVSKAYGALEEPFQGFLNRYKITAGEWDHLRALPTFEMDGAKFFDSSLSLNDNAARKLYEGVMQERAMAVLEPDARIRGLTTGGAQGGTLLGELARSATMFQSFSMTMIMTHMHALAIKDGVAGNRALNNVLFYISHVLMGAAIVQARQVLNGRDPINMSSPKFWYQSALQSGGAGYFGDLVGGVTGAADRSIIGKFSGPIGGMIDDAGRFGASVVQGRPGAIGKGIDLLQHGLIPGSNMWFSRLITDRLVFDQLHRMFDPTYSQTFARRAQQAQKQYGQDYFWPQGEVLPQRAPSITR